MRYQRLILGSGASAVTVRFHPRLTVVAGVGAVERESLIGELLGALAGSRRGTHLEVLDDSGRRLAVLREEAQSHDRVYELETGREITREFESDDGRVDLLLPFGLDLELARRRGRLSATDVAAASRSDALITALASVDQATLWAAADRVQATDARLKVEAELVGAMPEEAPLIEEIEKRHAAFEEAQRRHEFVRHHALFVAAACALGAAPAAALNRYTALPFLIVAMLTTFVSVRYRRRLATAQRDEQEALAAAGAKSYIGFHLARINSLLAGQNDRQRVAQVAVEHREALEAWRALAGEVPVEWALTMRERVTAAARRRTDNGEADSLDAGPSLRSVEPAELAQSLILRLTDLRHASAVGESLPLILDEPWEGVDSAVKQWMLELLGRSAGSPQVVYLTNDDEVAAWARMEAIAGHLAVLEPVPDADPRESSDLDSFQQLA